MSDLEKFLDLYKSFGIELTPEEDKEEIFVALREGEEGFGGYSGFYSEVVFDTEGKFKKQGFYE